MPSPWTAAVSCECIQCDNCVRIRLELTAEEAVLLQEGFCKDVT